MLLRRSLARRIGSAVVALVCVVGTVACGTSAPPAPAQVVGPPLAGEPIRVMTWAPASGPSPINHPDVAVVALAYANMVNTRAESAAGRWKCWSATSTGSVELPRRAPSGQWPRASWPWSGRSA